MGKGGRGAHSNGTRRDEHRSAAGTAIVLLAGVLLHLSSKHGALAAASSAALAAHCKDGGRACSLSCCLKQEGQGLT